MNESSLNRLAKCHPELSRRVLLLAANLAEQGILIEVVQGLRTFEEQNRLFAQGRTAPGEVVTRARGGYSNHNFTLACDVVPFENDKPNWNAPNSTWFTIGYEAEKLGLEWGGDWKKFIDRPHLQLPGMTIDECRAFFAKGGIPAVQAEASRRLGTAPQTQPQSSPAPQTAPPRPTLSFGSGMIPAQRGLNSDVKELQAKLNSVLPKLGIKFALEVDGMYGNGVEKAVRLFQGKCGLVPDGVCGKQVWAALDEALKQ